MSRFFDLVSKTARDMGATKANNTTPAALERRSRLIKLDSNENPFGPSARAVDAMKSTLGAANSYPDDDCSPLRLKLAAHHGLPPDQVLVTAGSTGMLSLLCQTLLAPGLNAVTSERSFIVYSMAVQAAGAHLVEVPMRDDGFDLEAILAAIDPNTRIVFLANPNNPTGTMLEADVVEGFLERLPGHVVLVLDEAYYEFALHFAALRKITYSNSLDYVRQGASVVVLRTFSKAHGLAGLRVGYGLGPAELLGYCARMRNTFSVSSVAQAAALAALDDYLHIQRVVENNALQSRVLTQGLLGLGYRVVPTAANFVYCDLREDATAIANRLQDEGVAVRPLGHWGAPNCIRVTIGTPEQDQTFLQAAGRVGLRGSAAGLRVSPTTK
ncbi:MAG TPA: histidinol-phosphate transaminase [Candidatus Sulfotelmatobacter sp.]|jgi:histidinol-phosphate aminotransferase|nr:histidinol-phosphate transaminase [Candidatus Sulfotelmatobacter sp.]